MLVPSEYLLDTKKHKTIKAVKYKYCKKHSLCFQGVWLEKQNYIQSN